MLRLLIHSFMLLTMEFTRVRNYKMTFEVWKFLEATHKRISEVKENANSLKWNLIKVFV
jgi:hypothetical protein